MSDIQNFIAIDLSWNDTRLFTLEDGLMFLKTVARSTRYDDDGKKSDEPKSYRIKLLTNLDLEQQQIDQLLGQRF